MMLRIFSLFTLLITLGNSSLEGRPIRQVFEKYRNPIFIETGSFIGDGIKMAVEIGFSKIYSIELWPIYYDYCKSRFSTIPHVQLFLGDSSQDLDGVLEKVDAPATFWLDGHWSGEGTGRGESNTALLGELAAIARHPIKNHTILIDDVRCFGTEDFDFLKLDDVIEIIMKINPNYTILFEDGAFPNDILVAYVPTAS